MNYLLTFTCFGSHLPGEEEGIVNRKKNRLVDPFVEVNQQLAEAVERCMEQVPYTLDLVRTKSVLAAMLETCEYRGWHVYAIHVRTNHAHLVLAGKDPPEKMLNDLKAYASRRLNQLKLDPPGLKRWARHGSTRYLNGERALAAAIRYVVEEQGEPMAVYPAPVRRPGCV